MATVSLIGIGKRYGSHIVIPNLDLEIADGSFVVLVGPSGCGKTTTLNMVAGLEPISSGRLLIGGRDVTDLASKDRNIAMVFQSYALFPHLSVFDNIAFGLKIRRFPKIQIQEQVREVAQRLHIADYLERQPKSLSGGQRQRVALARALVRRPGVFLMDEPLSNLDAKLRLEARSFLTRMHREIETTTIYVTHDQSEAMTMGDVIVVMNNGVIQQAAPPLEVYNNPLNIFVAGFIGSPPMNFLELSAMGETVVDLAHGIEIGVPERLRAAFARRKGEKVIVGLRPEALRPAPRDRAPASGLRLAVDVVQRLGHETLLDASCGPHRLVARASGGDDVTIGETRSFLYDPDVIHLFDPESGVNLGLREEV